MSRIKCCKPVICLVCRFPVVELKCEGKKKKYITEYLIQLEARLLSTLDCSFQPSSSCLVRPFCVFPTFLAAFGLVKDRRFFLLPEFV